MKRKYICRWLPSILPALALLAGCGEEEIVFESDIPRFEIREDRILIEVLVPSSTPTNDEIYIVGDFNGGEESAVGNLEWQLEMASDYDYRYGIYLDPSTFASNTSLGDGFYFYSASQGAERDLKGNEVIHTDDPEVGTRTNITIPRWASYFASSDDDEEDDDGITHDGYAIFVIDDTGYDELNMYAWGDDDGDNDALGSWPGMTQTGTTTISGREYAYFDTGADNEGLSLYLIFNDGGSNQLDNFEVTLNKDYYLLVTADGVTEIDPDDYAITHDGYVIYAIDNTGYETLALYAWGDAEAFGSWPGMTQTGTLTMSGQEYVYFDTGADNEGLTLNLIFNNNNHGSQLDDFEVTLDRDYYLELTADGVTEIESD